MTKEFVPYAGALALKQLGFDEDCFRYYNDDFKLSTLGLFYTYDNPSDFVCLAPTYSQAFDFFRKYPDWPIDSWIQPYLSEQPRQYEGFYWRRGEKVSVGVFSTFDEAQLNLLRKLIEIVKTKQ